MKTVNFLTAVNSGKRFRIIGTNAGWYEIDASEMLYFDNNQVVACSLDFYNSQFELEEKQITITESEFESAYLETYLDNLIFIDHISLMKKALGF